MTDWDQFNHNIGYEKYYTEEPATSETSTTVEVSASTSTSAQIHSHSGIFSVPSTVREESRHGKIRTFFINIALGITAFSGVCAFLFFIIGGVFCGISVHFGKCDAEAYFCMKGLGLSIVSAFLFLIISAKLDS